MRAARAPRRPALTASSSEPRRPNSACARKPARLFGAMAIALGLGGCGPKVSGVAPSLTAAHESTLRAEEPSLPSGACELRLYMEYAREGVLGIGAVELERDVITPGVCVKRRDAPLALPSRILIAAPRLGAYDYVCQGDRFRVKGDDRELCEWNHVFRNAYPFSFTFVAAHGKISDYMSLVRLYRNGSLIARYNAASVLENPAVLRFDASKLRVSDVYFGSRVPHLAAFDLRVLPVGASLDEAALSEELRDYRAIAAARASALLRDTLGALDPTLEEALACPLARVERLKRQAQKLVEPVPVPALPEGCQVAPGAPEPSQELGPVSELYARKKGQSRAEVEKLDAKIQEHLSREIPKLRSHLPQIRKELEAKVAGEKQRQALARLDAAIADAALAADQAIALAKRLRERALGAIESQEHRARVYEAAVSSLERSGNVFEAYTENPQPSPDEQRLDMKYGDRFQWFLLAPWHGVPVSLADGGSLGQLDASTAIPIVDLFGARVQWAPTRFSEVRAGIGGMYFRDRIPRADGTTRERYAGAFQANLGISNFKAGMAWVPRSKQLRATSWAQNELRLLVGADLIKLISGNNAEAF